MGKTRCKHMKEDWGDKTKLFVHDVLSGSIGHLVPRKLAHSLEWICLSWNWLVLVDQDKVVLPVIPISTNNEPMKMNVH